MESDKHGCLSFNVHCANTLQCMILTRRIGFYYLLCLLLTDYKYIHVSVSWISRLINPILILIRFVTDRLRKYILLIYFIDGEEYFMFWTMIWDMGSSCFVRPNGHIVKHIFNLKHKYCNQLTKLILILTYCDTLFNIKKQIFLLSLPCFHAMSKRLSIWNTRNIHLRKNLLLIRHRLSIVFRSSPHEIYKSFIHV